MSAPVQLARPPITEALLDVRALPRETITPDRLAELRAELASAFPTAQEGREVSAQFNVRDGKLLPPSAPSSTFRGLRLLSQDGTRAVQFRTDGFTFNNIGIGSYIGGEALIAEGLRLWSLFASVARPETVARVALRYLNRLELPLHHGVEFTQFLTSPPALPEGAPRLVSAFLSRVIGHDETGAIVVVTQKLDPVREEAQAAVLLDIDAFFADLQVGTDVGDLRPYFDRLRDLKNRTFFALITDETVKLFQ